MDQSLDVSPNQNTSKEQFAKQESEKISFALLSHVYLQTNVAMLSSLFCASIIFIGLYMPNAANIALYYWATFFLMITMARMILVSFFKQTKSPEKKLSLWRYLYILGSFFGGFSWGVAGIFLLPYATPEQQVLLVLMLAGVTAGAVPLAAAIPESAILFLATSLLPFIVAIFLFKNHTYFLFDAALTLYLGYTIVLTIKIYKLIKRSIVLQFENDLLLNNLEISNKKLAQAATHDPLTHVANRRLFESNLETAIKNAQQRKTMIALFYMDLDRFKAANDIYGHQAGDHILVTVIERLSDFFGKMDHIARLGGDELAIIVENMNSREEVESIAKKICQLIALPIHLNQIQLKVSASIGISLYPHDGKDEEHLIRCADKCMYYAKEHGGNTFHFSDMIA